jgi:hypothetical protein
MALSILMWANIIGPFRFLDPPPEHAAQTLGLWIPRSPSRVVAPETSRRLTLWRRMLEGERDVIAHHELAQLIAAGVGTIAVPDGRGLADGELEQLRAFAAQGGGVVLCGWIAVADSGGQWRGDGAMRNLLAADRIERVSTGEPTSLVAARNGPLAVQLAQGETIRLAAEPEAPALLDSSAEIRWATTRPGATLAASRRLLVGRGRLVWLAAGPERAWEADIEPWQPMPRLLVAAIAWAARSPILEWSDRPGGDQLVAKLSRVGPQRLLIDVSNLGSDPVRSARLRVHVYQRLRDASVSANQLLQQAPSRQLRPGAEFVDLALPDLPAGASRSYSLDFAPLEHPPAD